METTIGKENSEQKLRGGYYTPEPIANFICKWAITKATQRVLEPSCGDGNFIEAAIKRFLELGVQSTELFGLVKGIELAKKEAEKSKNRAAKYGLNSTTIVNSDFFDFISKAQVENHYDVVIGNPPFIRYQNFPEQHREKAFELMRLAGLSPNKLTNIWVPFLILASKSLNRYGKLGMVIPAELFQVKYAAETRIFLSNYFSRITIVTFKKLVFDGIQQEVVLLLCEKDTRSNNGIRVVELDTLSDLEHIRIDQIQKNQVKTLEHNSEKWTKYFLDEDEIQLLRKIKSDPRISTCGSEMDVDVGLVTGRNEFFMIDKKTVENWNLEPYVIKVVGKSNHFKGITFDDGDFEVNVDALRPDYLFLPPNVEFNQLPEVCKAYIRYGEEQGYHNGYKCKIRKRWYITPSLWSPDAFVLRQVGDYPKMIVNKTRASSTDTIHRVKFKSKRDPLLFAVSFLNSVTFAFSEILGRSYGGGVLTFEPTEIEEIPLPLLNTSSLDFKKIDSLIRQRRIQEVLDIVDQELLIHQLKFSQTEVKMLRQIWEKLSQRRLNRRRK